MAGSTGFETATSGLTVQCANQAAPRARIYFFRAWRTSVDHTMAQRARQLPSHIRRSPTEGGAMLPRLRAHAPRPPSPPPALPPDPPPLEANPLAPLAKPPVRLVRIASVVVRPKSVSPE